MIGHTSFPDSTSNNSPLVLGGARNKLVLFGYTKSARNLGVGEPRCRVLRTVTSGSCDQMVLFKRSLKRNWRGARTNVMRCSFVQKAHFSTGRAGRRRSWLFTPLCCIPE